jgi:hypothetical protein
MHQVEGANPSALTICPCGVVQPTRLPLKQEITSLRSSSYGSVNHMGLPRRSAVAEAGQGRQLQFALKALSAMHSLGAAARQAG